MDEFRDRLDRAFETYPGQRRGLAKRIADRCDVSDQAVGRWRKTGKVQRENLAPLADELGVSVEWLLTGRGSMRRPSAGDMEIIIAGDTARGVDPRRLKRQQKPGDLIVRVPDNNGAAFAIRVSGAPELWPRYNEGEIVVVALDSALQSGSDVYLQVKTANRREASLWRLAWENRGEVALDPVTAQSGEGRIVVNADEVELCRPVLAILPPAAIEEATA